MNRESIILLSGLFVLFCSCMPSMKQRIRNAQEDVKHAPVQKRDTVLVLLPGLLLFREHPERHNAESYKIVCLDKKQLVTRKLEEISHCECRLYQLERATVKRMRVMWSAYPVSRTVWDRTYFNEAGEAIDKDKLEVTIPYHSALTRVEHYFSENKVIVTAYFEMKVIRVPGSRI